MQKHLKSHNKPTLTEAKHSSPLAKLKHWLYQQDCVLCHRTLEPTHSNHPLCQHCERALPKIKQSCSLCNTPLQHNAICGICLSNHRHWTRCHAAFSYHDPIKQLINQYKYQNQAALAETLANLLIQHIINTPTGKLPDYLIPVPMHHKRLIQRGYNQSQRLCHVISKALHIETANIIGKTQATTTQTQQTATERKRLIQNTFALKKTITANKVAIIDDVMTTGATATEIAKLLKKSNISDIEVWVLART